MLNCLHLNFDIITIPESTLQKGREPVIDINIPNYAYEHTPSEASKGGGGGGGGTLIYISDHLDYKP